MHEQPPYGQYSQNYFIDYSSRISYDAMEEMQRRLRQEAHDSMMELMRTWVTRTYDDPRYRSTIPRSFIPEQYETQRREQEMRRVRDLVDRWAHVRAITDDIVGESMRPTTTLKVHEFLTEKEKDDVHMNWTQLPRVRRVFC